MARLNWYDKEKKEMQEIPTSELDVKPWGYEGSLCHFDREQIAGFSVDAGAVLVSEVNRLMRVVMSDSKVRVAYYSPSGFYDGYPVTASVQVILTDKYRSSSIIDVLPEYQQKEWSKARIQEEIDQCKERLVVLNKQMANL